ncbi:MAG: hypothetical protein LBI17_02275 [Rickettsiales bacterium]|nr:hypothetical protein [Rickettsiales bacterium]
MVDYKSGVDIDKYRISVMLQILFFIAGHRDVTVFADNSVGTKRSTLDLFSGTGGYIGYVMDIEKVMNYNFNPEYTYPLKPGQRPVSRTVLVRAWDKLKADRLAEARREYEMQSALEISPDEIAAITGTGRTQPSPAPVPAAARGGNRAARADASAFAPVRAANRPVPSNLDEASRKFEATLGKARHYAEMDGSIAEARRIEKYLSRPFAAAGRKTFEDRGSR